MSRITSTYRNRPSQAMASAVAAAALYCIVCMAVSGCAPARFPVIRPAYRMSRTELERFRAEEYFIKARDYDRRGLSQMAEHFYGLAFEFDPESKILRDLLTVKLIETGKYTQAIIAVKGDRTPEQLPDNDRRLLSTIYMKMGQFDQAAATLEMVSARSLEERYSLGLLHEAAGDLAKAADGFEGLYRETDTAFEAGMKAATLRMRLKQFGRAESLLVTLDRERKGSAEILNMFGMLHLMKGDTAQAVSFFRMTTIEDSTAEEALHTLAQIYIKQNRYADAIECYRRLFVVPYWGAIYGKTLALLYYYDEQYDSAQALIVRLLEENIDDFELHYYLGLVASSKDDLVLARLEFEKTVALKESFEDAWRQLCHLGLREKNLDAALDDAKRFTRLLPASPAAWRTLGFVFNARRDFKASVPALKKAAQLDSTDVFSLFELGSALERTREFAAAAQVFRKILALKPDDAVTANYLGYMWAEQGVNLDSAIVLIELALSVDPDNGAYLDSYAWAYYRKGDVDKALEYMRKAMAVLDDDPVIYEHLGDILEKKQEYEGALKAFERSLECKPADRAAVVEKADRVRRLLGVPDPAREPQ